jgi:photosystem II stability/assembly factor-like uncharacterized protein
MRTKFFILVAVSGFLSLEAICQQDNLFSRVPENLKNRNVFKRFTWFYEQRAFPSDTFPAGIYRKEMNREIEKAKLNAGRTNDNCQWRSIGPNRIYSSNFGYTSGRTRALAIHPNDPNTVYIGAACGGIWKTTDGGATWMDIGSNLESLSYGAIAIDPSNPEVVYAGSGEADMMGWFAHFDGRGLFKSTDGGNSWIKITNGFGDYTSFSDIVVSPYNSNIVLCTLGSGNFFTGFPLPNDGIWKSTDAGMTWTRTLIEEDACDILFHPTDPDIIYAAIGGMQEGGGFYISTDQGDTWTRSSNGLPAPEKIARIQIDLARSNPSVIYAYTCEITIYNPPFGISTAYKSVDGGHNWTQISAGVPLGGNTFDIEQGTYDFCIAVDPKDENHVFVGNVKIHETTNGSLFTTAPRFNSVHDDHHQVMYAPSNPDYMYFVNDGGVYKSVNGGLNLLSVNNGMTTFQFYRVASSPFDSLTVIGGAQDSGVMISFDGGQTWTLLVVADGTESFFDYADPSIVYTSGNNGALFKSMNGGHSFNNLTYMDGPWIIPFFMHPVNHTWLYTANLNFYFYNGMQMQAIAEDISSWPVYISSIAQSRMEPDHLILATSMSYTNYVYGSDSLIMVKVSSDGGYNWTDVTANIPGETRWISRVVADPEDANTFYVVRTGFSPENKIYRTTDLGVTWTNLSGDLPDLPTSDLFIDPRQEGHMYVANDFGVYRTTDGGVTWVYQGDGIPRVPVFDFDYNEYGSNRILRIATHGRSIYETHLSKYEGIDNANIMNSSVSHYPEPVTYKTDFTYSINEPAAVTLQIFNIYGQQVDAIDVEMQSRGSHQLAWYPEGLASGIYFYRLNAGNQSYTGKIMVVR